MISYLKYFKPGGKSEKVVPNWATGLLVGEPIQNAVLTSIGLDIDPKSGTSLVDLHSENRDLLRQGMLESGIQGVLDIFGGPILLKGISKLKNIFKFKNTLPTGTLQKTKSNLLTNVDPHKALELTKERIANGGAKRLKSSILEGDPVERMIWENGMPEPIEGKLSIDFYNDVPSIVSEEGLEIPASQFNKTTGMDMKPEALGVGLPQRTFVTFTDAPKTPGTIMKSHEYAHFVHTPINKAPGINYSYLEKLYGKDGPKYFTNLNSTEVSARFTQLKNYFGLKEGQEITPEMWEYAKQHYVNDTGLDNNMTDFFNMVESDKLKDFLKWGNKNAPIILAPLTVKSSEELSKKINIKKPGGIIKSNLPGSLKIGITRINMISSSKPNKLVQI